MFGMTVVFCLGAFGGVFYAMLSAFGFASTSGRLNGTKGFDFNAATYYIIIMFYVPLIGFIVLAFIEPGPGIIGFALSSSLATIYFARGFYKQNLA
jgi:hypothetical protein